MPPYDALEPEEHTRTIISVVPGRTLATLLSEEPGNLDEILPILLQILQLLDSLHSSGLDHHRLSPASIRLDEKDRPDVHTYNKSAADSQTVPVIESKYVLSEAFWEGTEDQPCATSDSYLIGFIFYELLLGRQRFKAQFAAVESGPASAWLSWHADRSRKLIPLSELLPNFPVSLSRLIGEMTEKNPLQRTSDFKHMVRRLETAGEDTAFIHALSANGEETMVFVSAKGQPLNRKNGQKRSLWERKREGNDENSAKLDHLLQSVEERRAAAKVIADRASELEKSGAIAEALQQWASIRDVYPSFPDLESQLQRLKGLLPEVSEQEEQTAQLHSKHALLEHVFENREQQPQIRTKHHAARTFAVLSAAALSALLLWRHYHWGEPVSPSQHVPVELQANASKAEFTVDGKRILSASVNLTPGPHQAQAWADGYEPISRTFTVSKDTPNTVSFHLQSMLPSLELRTSVKGLQYVLDGDDPAKLERGALREEHLVSGRHTLQILKNGKQVFSLEFQTAPHTIKEVDAHAAAENISALITSSSHDSARLYATPDWKITFGSGAPFTPSLKGLDLSPQEIGRSAFAQSGDGEVMKLDPSHPEAPVLKVLLKGLPKKAPVTLLAKSSPEKPARVQLNLTLLKQKPVLSLNPGLSDAGSQAAGQAIAPNRRKNELTPALQRDHHIDAVTKKSFEEYLPGVAPSSGESFVSASAPDFRMTQPKVMVENGNWMTVNLALPAAAKANQVKPAPLLFPNLLNAADDWRKDAEGWWVHNNPGYAFLERNQGSFLLSIRRRPERGLFNRNKKVTFVVNYKGENDCVLYSLDEHTLYRKVFPEENQNEYRKRHGAWDQAYVLRLAITPEKVILQDRNGNTLDSLLLAPGKGLGKIGFLGPVALKSQAP